MLIIRKDLPHQRNQVLRQEEEKDQRQDQDQDQRAQRLQLHIDNLIEFDWF